MKRASYILLMLVGLATGVRAQVTPQKLTSGDIDRKKWPKIGQGLSKSFRKDSLDPEASYMLSLYFLSSRNPAYQIDSSWYYMKKSLVTFGKTSPKVREQLKKLPLDSLILIRLAARIDSLSFEIAKQSNSEASYQHFI